MTRNNKKFDKCEPSELASVFPSTLYFWQGYNLQEKSSQGHALFKRIGHGVENDSFDQNEMPHASLKNYLRIAQAMKNKDEETLCQVKEYKGKQVKMRCSFLTMTS